MLDFKDERWVGLQGGYRMPFDPRPGLLRLESGNNLEAAWAELWEQLHHQGDVGEVHMLLSQSWFGFTVHGGSVDGTSMPLLDGLNFVAGGGRIPSYRRGWRRIISPQSTNWRRLAPGSSII